jgi:hypothetical protein
MTAQVSKTIIYPLLGYASLGGLLGFSTAWHDLQKDSLKKTIDTTINTIVNQVNILSESSEKNQNPVQNTNLQSTNRDFDRLFICERTLRYAGFGMLVGIFPPIGIPIAWWMCDNKLISPPK